MFLGITTEGMEEIAAAEVKGKISERKRVIFSKEKKKYYSLQKVIKIGDQGTFTSFDELVDKLKKRKYKIKNSFVVDCTREGEHPFGSVDIEKEVAHHLIEKGYAREYKTPETKIYVDIIDQSYSVGYLIADRLCRREYRIKINNQSVNGCIAYACVKMSEAKKTDIIVDPFCKDGVIAIEAAQQGIKQITALDANGNNIRNAKINGKMAKVKIDFQQKDVSWLETLFKKKSVDKIVTNAFIGFNENERVKAIKEMLHIGRVIVKDSITMLTNKGDVLRELCAKEFTIIKENEISVGDMHYTILKIKSNQ